MAHNLLKNIIFSSLALIVWCAAGSDKVRAQTVFCSSTVTDPNGVASTGVTLQNGACTNRGQTSGTGVGAFSGAALATQSVSNLAQSMSVVQTTAASQQIEQRRATEAKSCPPGQSVVDGVCRPPVSAPAVQPRPPAAPVVARPVPTPRRSAKPPVAAAKPPVAAAKPPVAAAKPPVAAAKPSVAAAKPPVTAAKPAPVAAKRPAAAARPRVTSSETVVQNPDAAEGEGSAPPPAAMTTAGRPVKRVAAPRRAPEVVEETAPIPTSPPAYLPPASYVIPAHFGAWAQGFGDYEHRSGQSTSTLQCCDMVAIIPLDIRASSNTTSAGFMGGIDWTKRDVLYGGDGLILGVTGGYLDSTVDVRTSAISTVPVDNATSSGVGNGSASARAHLSGPSLGAYVSYFNGPWSNDLLIKNDFLSLDTSFTGTEAYQVCGCNTGTFVPFTTTLTGGGQTSLNEFTVNDNLSYRIPLIARVWMEPTAGVQYTLSSYSSSAAALGLKDGDLVRLQGGARVGTDGVFGAALVTASLTGLVYDDVLVSGNFIQGGVFGSTGNILNDQGKARGEGILSLNVDLGAGKSIFVAGDVRGGDGLFGAGGKGGFRLAW